MGYYTDYEITVTDKETGMLVSCDEYIKELEEISGYGIENEGQIATIYEVKWYRNVQDLKKFSKLHPKWFIEVDGDGEEQGDQWIQYHENGKTQLCNAIITFEPYDASEMK